MQTTIATACLSGTRSDALQPATESDPARVDPHENHALSLDGEPKETPVGLAATLAPAFVATITGLPPASRS